MNALTSHAWASSMNSGIDIEGNPQDTHTQNTASLSFLPNTVGKPKYNA